MWLIFEGLDKSGKTTLEWEFLKKTNYKYNIIDRGPVGYLTFDKIFMRSTSEGDKEHLRMIDQVNNSSDFYVVYCKVDRDIAYQRLMEKDEICPYNYRYAQSLLDRDILLYDPDKVLEIDTGKSTIEECSNKLVDWFMEKYNGRLT